ncbi:MAG TPA: V-type ATP synthase subunit D [Acidothermaceae bacterium]|nr:V-type ATP synthase subunit D [Acidothermaceae bacterium]
MVAAVRTPAGRAGRLWLRHRIAVAERGASELERKVQLVSNEVRRRKALVDQSRARWRSACEEAERWMLRAGFVGGIDSVREARADPVDVAIAWTTTMGVRHPDHATIEPPATPDVGMSAAVLQARQAFAVALLASADVATAQSALATLESDLLKTRRRARVLRRHWLPRLQSQLHDLEFTLEQAEQEDQARLRRVSA